MGVIGFTVIVQFLIVQFGGTAAGTTGLDGPQWLYCVVVGLFCIPFGDPILLHNRSLFFKGVLIRYIPVPDEKGVSVSELKDIEAPLLQAEKDTDSSDGEQPIDEKYDINLREVRTAKENWEIARKAVRAAGLFFLYWCSMLGLLLTCMQESLAFGEDLHQESPLTLQSDQVPSNKPSN